MQANGAVFYFTIAGLKIVQWTIIPAAFEAAAATNAAAAVFFKFQTSFSIHKLYFSLSMIKNAFFGKIKLYFTLANNFRMNDLNEN